MDSEVSITTHSNIKRGVKEVCKIKWQRQWDVSDSGRVFHSLKPSIDEKSLFDYPNRKMFCQIEQLRMRYTQLNKYLHQIGVKDSPLCECGSPETVEHYLLNCERYFDSRESMRTKIFNTIGEAELTLNLLLRHSDFLKVISDILSDFIIESNRFQ